MSSSSSFSPDSDPPHDPPISPFTTSPSSLSSQLPSISPQIPRASYPPPPRAAKPTISKLVKRSSSLKEEDDLAEEGPTGLNFSIRFTSQGQEDLLDLWVGGKENVRDVKRRIRFLRPSLMTPEGRPLRLRLIQLGRLLTDGTFLVPYTVQLLSHRAKLVKNQQDDELNLVEGVRNGTIFEAVGREIGLDLGAKEADKGKGKGKGKEKVNNNWDGLENEAEEDKRIWLHCSVGEAMEDDEIEGEKVQTTQIKPLEGFDRLLDAGFSPEEIATMREEFRQSAAATLPDGGDQDEHARALEDQWMEGLTGHEEASFTDATNVGDQMALLQGICMGFFLPFLPFFFFRTQIFSQKTQMGIFGGLVINISFAVMRMLN